MNKKAQGLSVTTIVIVVLAIIVLVVLILGFTGGWGNLWERMKGFFGGGDNVDAVIQACNVACTTEAKHDYCYRKRTVVLDDKTKINYFSCYPLWGFYYDLGFQPCDEMVCDKLDCKEGYGGKWLFNSECKIGWILQNDESFARRSGLTEKNKAMKTVGRIAIRSSDLDLKEDVESGIEELFENSINLAQEDIVKETMSLIIYVSPEERKRLKGEICCIVVDKVYN